MAEIISHAPPSLTPPFGDLEKNWVIPGLKQCNYCRRKGSNLCTRCKGVFYCSRECQTKDWSAHKKPCGAIHNALLACKQREKELDEWTRRIYPDLVVDDQYNEQYDSALTMTTITRELLSSAYVSNLKHSKQAIHEGISCYIKMLHNCSSPYVDDNSVNSIADLFLRIGQDQYTYEYIRWYVHYTASEKTRSRMILPLDRSEPLTAYQMKKIPLFVHVLYTLMKIRMYLFAKDRDLVYHLVLYLKQYKPNSALYKVGCSRDVLGVIRGYMVDPLFLPPSQYAVHDTRGLHEQLIQLLKSGEEKNSRLWKVMISPIRVGIPNTSMETSAMLENFRNTWFVYPAACLFLNSYLTSER